MKHLTNSCATISLFVASTTLFSGCFAGAQRTDDDGVGLDESAVSTNPAWPNAKNTGIAGVGLRSEQLGPWTTGTLTVTTPNKVFENFRHQGRVVIEADNVTLRRCLIEGNGGGLIIQVNAKRFTIEDCTVRGNSTADKQCAAVIGYGNYTARRVDVGGCADSFKISNEVEISSSYSHDLFKWGTVAEGGSHNDSMQLTAGGASRVIIRGNAFYHHPCASNRHVQMPSSATIDAFYMDNNYFYGSNGILNLTGSVDGGTFSNNVLAGSRRRGFFAGRRLFTGGGIGGLRFAGNRFESGEGVGSDIRLDDYECVKP